MTHDHDTVRTERDTSSCDLGAGEGRMIVDQLDYRDVSGSAMLPFPKPPPVPDFAAQSPPGARRGARDAPTPGGSVAPVAFGSTPPPDPSDLERIRREVRRRTALAICAMAVPVATMLAIGAAGSDDKGHAAGAAQAQAGMARHALELTQAAARHERQTLGAVERDATDAFAATSRVTVPETVIVGVLRTMGPSEPAPAQLEPSAGSSAALDAPEQAPAAAIGTLDALKLAPVTRRLSPVDSPLAVDATAAPGATELEVTHTARPVVPSTESQVRPTRLEPDNVSARGRLDTGR